MLGRCNLRQVPRRAIWFFFIIVVLICAICMGILQHSIGIGQELSPKAVQRIDVAVQEELRHAQDGQHIKVFVEMNDVADLERAKEEVRESESSVSADVAQRKAVIGALQETAEVSQANLIDYLELKKSTQEVSQYESFYIINTVMVVSSPHVINDIAEMDAVKAIHAAPQIKQVEPVPDKNRSSRSRRSLESDDGIEWGLKAMSVPRVWDELHITGSGVTVGILDSGTNYNHPAILHQFMGYNPATQAVENKGLYKDFVDGDITPQPKEELNHGTHVAGTICGSDGEFNRIGVAPSARFVAGRVIGAQEGGAEDILRGAQWMLAPDGHAEYAPRVINNSWGGPNDDDPWFMAIADKWRAAGIVPVFAAGNMPGGKSAPDGSIANPGNQPNVFAVGAVDINQQLAPFSQVGPSPFDPQRIKPDACAPGVQVRSCLATGGYTSWNGTSMAAPHVTGVIALMLEANPHLSVDEIESILKDTAIARTDTRYAASPNMGYGYGLVNAYDAVRAAQDRAHGTSTDERITLTGHVLTHGTDSSKPLIKAQLDNDGYATRSYSVIATIEDDVSVTSAYVAYKKPQDSRYHLLELKRQEGDVKRGRYSAYIPGDALIPDALEVRLVATDFSSQEEAAKHLGTSEIEAHKLDELGAHPHICLTQTHQVRVQAGVVPGAYHNDFEQDCAGWLFTGELGGAKVESDWGWGTPTLAKEPKPYGSKLIGVKIGSRYPTKHIDSYAYMPPLDLSDPNLSQVNLNFDEYLGFDGVCDARIQIALSDAGPWKDLDEKLIPPTSSPAWHHVSYNLDEYVGTKDPVHIRWYFHFPDHGDGVGWYIDNVAVGLGDASAPSPVSLNGATQYMEGIQLSWQASPENDVTSYVIYRGTHADSQNNDLKEIATVSKEAAALRYTDVHVTDGTYVYAVRARDSFGNESAVEQVVQVPYQPLKSLVSYDFNQDDGHWRVGALEGGNQVWEHGKIPRYANDQSVFSLREAQLGLDERSGDERVWGTKLGSPISGSDLSDGRLHAGIHCYVQSPEFTINASDLSSEPVLSFASYNAMHYLDEYQQDLETVEVVTSSNNESHPLVSAAEIMKVDGKFRWQHLQKSLGQYLGKPISLRFVMKTGNRSLFDAYELGWYIDNVLVGEAPKVFTNTDLHLDALVRNGASSSAQPAVSTVSSMPELAGATNTNFGDDVASGDMSSRSARSTTSMPAPPAQTVPILGGYVDIDHLGRTQRTVDTDGSYVCRVASGTWKMTARAYGYIPQTIEVSQDTHHDFILEPAARAVIIGHVLDSDGNPIPHAHVRLLEDSNIPPVTCDAQGAYRIECYEGSYQIRAYAPGFAANTQPINPTPQHTADNPLHVDLRLSSVSGVKETIAYDNNSCKTSLIFAGKDKGAAVRFYPAKQDGRLTEAQVYIENVPVLETNDMTLVVLQEDEHQRMRTLARIPDMRPIPGQWNTIDLSAFNIKTNKAFYIAAVQNHPSGKTYGVGIDTQGLDKEAIKNSYLYDGSFTPASKANVVGAFMIRATMLYPQDAKPNPPEADPNTPPSHPVSSSDIFEWELTSDGSAYVVKRLIGPIPEDREIIVPSTHEGKPVVEVGKQAFAWKYLNKLVLPEGVVRIGEGALSAAVKQEGILDIPSTVTTIDPGAFASLNGVTVTGMEGMTSVPAGVFAGMWSSTIYLPNATQIADDAFGGSAGYNAEYNRIITADGNPHGLVSKDGLYLINPAQLIVDVEIAETEEIDQTVTYIGEDNTSQNYDRSLPASAFYQVGQKVTVKAPRNVLVVYDEEQKTLVLPAPKSHTTFTAHRIEAATRAPLVEGEKPAGMHGETKAERGAAVVGYSLPQASIVVTYKGLEGTQTWEGQADEDGLYAIELTGYTPLAGANLTISYTTPSGKQLNRSVGVVNRDTADQTYLMETSSAGVLRRYLSDNPQVVLPMSARDYRGGERVVKEIGPLAFEGLGITRVTGLKENENITRVQMGAFAHNNLEQLEFGNNLTAIDAYAFAYNRLRDIKLPNLMHKLGDYSFAHNSIEEFNAGTYTGHFGSYCLAYNSLRNLIIPKKVEEIGKGAFAHNNLEHVVFLSAPRDDVDVVSSPSRRVDNTLLHTMLAEHLQPMSSSGHSHVLTHIASHTFGYNNLAEVVLPAEVSEVDDTAFEENGRLVNLITNNGKVHDAILREDSGHIVNGVSVTARFVDEQGNSIRPPMQYVGKHGMTERKGSTIASDYYRSGEQISMNAPLLHGYEAISSRSSVLAQVGAPNEMIFVYRAIEGETPDPNPTPIPVPDNPDPHPNPEPNPNPEPAPEPVPNPGPTPSPEPAPHPNPEPSPSPDPQPDPNIDPGSNPGPHPNPSDDTQPDGADTSSSVRTDDNTRSDTDFAYREGAQEGRDKSKKLGILNTSDMSMSGLMLAIGIVFSGAGYMVYRKSLQV